MLISPIATANPKAYTQKELLSFFHLEGNAFAERIFESSNVRRRHLAVTPELMAKNPLQREPELAVELRRLAHEAIGKLELDKKQLAGIITASVGVVSFPTLSHMLHSDLGLGDSVDFSCRAGDGCVAGIVTIRDAMRICRDNPGKSVLVVCVDLMSGHFGTIPHPDDRHGILNSCLFGDGCAAFLVGPPSSQRTVNPRVVATKTMWVPDTLDHMVFEHQYSPPRVRLSKKLPEIARTVGAPAVLEFLRQNELPPEQVKHWMIHPGGRAILDGFKDGLGLEDAHLEHSAGVLRDYGNMSSPTSMFVMKSVCDSGDPRPGDYGLMVTVATGLTLALMLVRWE